MTKVTKTGSCPQCESKRVKFTGDQYNGERELACEDCGAHFDERTA